MMLAVYDGRSCLGFILSLGVMGFEAFDADERSLGRFETRREAADAVVAAHKAVTT